MMILLKATLMLMDEISDTLIDWASNIGSFVLKAIKILAEFLFFGTLGFLIIVTTPLWIIPYNIYKRFRK